MHAGVIGHRKAWLHGAEITPGLDLCRGQRHQCTMMDAMKGDLLDVGWNIMEVGVDEGAPGVDNCHSRIRR